MLSALTSIRFRRAWKVQGHSIEELPFKALGGVWGSWLGVVLIVLVLIAQFYVVSLYCVPNIFFTHHVCLVQALFPVGGVSGSNARANSFFQAYLAFPILLAMWVG